VFCIIIVDVIRNQLEAFPVSMGRLQPIRYAQVHSLMCWLA
jgi:hypothetical protein